MIKIHQGKILKGLFDYSCSIFPENNSSHNKNNDGKSSTPLKSKNVSPPPINQTPQIKEK